MTSIHIHIEPTGHIHVYASGVSAGTHLAPPSIAPPPPAASDPLVDASFAARPSAAVAQPSVAQPAAAAQSEAAAPTGPHYFEDMDPTQGWTPVLDIASPDRAVIARGHEAWLSFLSLLLNDDAYTAWCEAQSIDPAVLSTPTDRIALFEVFGSGGYAQAICSYVKACGGLTHAVARHLMVADPQERAVESLQIAGRIVQISSVAWDTLGHYMEWPLVHATPDVLTQRLARIMETGS